MTLPIMGRSCSDVFSSPFLASVCTLFLHIAIHLRRYHCQLHTIHLRSVSLSSTRQLCWDSHRICGHQLDFSTWCLHRFLKLNRTKTSQECSPFHGFLSLFIQLIIPESGSHPCSAVPLAALIPDGILQTLTHSICLICVFPSIPAMTLVILISPILLNWPFYWSSRLRSCPPPISLPHDSHSKLSKGHGWLKTHQLLSLPRGQSPNS